MRLAPLALTAAALVASQSVLAQDYPSRPSRIVVPFAAGATNDIIARLVGQSLADQLKQPFLVDNRAGASGIPGTDFVAKAAPDGYTLLLGNTSLLGIQATDRKSTRLNSSHSQQSRMPSSA